MKPSLSSQGRDLLGKAIDLWQPLEMANSNDMDIHRNPRLCPLRLIVGPTQPWEWASVCLTPAIAACSCVHLSFGLPLLWESPLIHWEPRGLDTTLTSSQDQELRMLSLSV